MKILQVPFRPHSVLFKPKLREHKHKNVIVIMARFIQLLASQKQPGYRCSVKTKIHQTAFKCSQIYTTLPLCATRVWWKWLKSVVRAQPKIRRTRSKCMQHLFQQKGNSVTTLLQPFAATAHILFVLLFKEIFFTVFQNRSKMEGHLSVL